MAGRSPLCPAMPPRSYPPLPSTGLSATSCLLTADLAALGHGDHAALGRIHHITRRLLWRTIERIVDTPAIADEVLQDTFIKIWMTADRFDPRKASPWTWMTAIARHAAIDRLRHHRRRVATVSLDALHDEEHAEDGAASPTPAPADIDGSRGDPCTRCTAGSCVRRWRSCPPRRGNAWRWPTISA
ncbi:RNA polymerase sigma factor [Piscinibacter aquaticus]|uniref:RNA polymerase sigma factor n=1 Tax=Piscinibacter aquaticus TaxID=392597 RepID=A0A5C6TYR2_9BURK|nr:RNA polymerase sigma factor [Piscinibacter aquaticus]